MSDEITRIIAAVEPTICPTWSIARGETLEGRISEDDFWKLVALARNGAKAETP